MTGMDPSIGSMGLVGIFIYIFSGGFLWPTSRDTWMSFWYLVNELVHPSPPKKVGTGSKSQIGEIKQLTNLLNSY